VQIYKVDCGFIDICMGKLDLHERNRAIITRYLSTPISGLRDLGIYTLALANLHQGATTPALQRLGVLAPNQDPRPLSPDTTILAIASQQTLFTEELTLTRQGVAKLGLRAAPARQAPDTTQPLFFIPSDQFGTLTVPLIDSMIGACEDARSGNTASPSDESNQPNIALGSHVLPCTPMKNMEKAAPQPPTGGGNISACDCSSGKCAPQARANQQQPVETESAQLLRDSGVKSATLIRQLGQLPIDIVMKAISTARSRPTTQDVGGVACSMLRDFRNHATPIPDPVRSGNSGATAAEIRESFLRLGYPLSDPSPADPRRAEDNLARQAAGVVWDAPCSTPDPVIKLWNGLLAALQTQIPRSEFNTWFRHMALLSVESGVALIQAGQLHLNSNTSLLSF